MKKQTIVILVLVVLVAGGFGYWKLSSSHTMSYAETVEPANTETIASNDANDADDPSATESEPEESEVQDQTELSDSLIYEESEAEKEYMDLVNSGIDPEERVWKYIEKTGLDENGDIITGDHILYIYGCYMKEQGVLEGNKVVTTVMSNFGLYKAFDAVGIEYEKTAVGDKYVYEYAEKHIWWNPDNIFGLHIILGMNDI